MTPLYANGFNLNLNEIAILEFRVNTQVANQPVAYIAIHYEFLKKIHEVIGNGIAQHEAKLHELQRSDANMN